MSELNELYQEMILEHNRRPRNFRPLPGATRQSEGYNPLCGDRLQVYLKMEDGIIRDISFEGSGCAISKASASMMTSAVKGKSRAEVAELIESFRKMLNRGLEASFDEKRLGKLAVFSGVSEFPARVKCANLAWYTLLAGLEERAGVVNTEKEDKP